MVFAWGIIFARDRRVVVGAQNFLGEKTELI
jgi:hypothetical protein